MVQLSNLKMSTSHKSLLFAQCIMCKKYLSSAPVLVQPDGSSVCSSCSNENEPRNTSYEAIAKYMIFPCRNRSRGCTKPLKWNESIDHESSCSYNSKIDTNRLYELIEKCDLCARFLANSPRYLCSAKHYICYDCKGRRSSICPLCQSKIQNEMSYLCQYCDYGCEMQDTKDVVSRHEIDCSMREYRCPFIEFDCKWVGAVHKIMHHLEKHHLSKIFKSPELQKVVQKADDIWAMIAFNEIFKCYLWIFDSEIEWIVKYIGPQRLSTRFGFEIRIEHESKKAIVRKATCHSWNNCLLEKSVKFDLSFLKDYICDGKILYNITIYKKQYFL